MSLPYKGLDIYSNNYANMIKIIKRFNNDINIKKKERQIKFITNST